MPNKVHIFSPKGYTVLEAIHYLACLATEINPSPSPSPLPITYDMGLAAAQAAASTKFQKNLPVSADGSDRLTHCLPFPSIGLGLFRNVTMMIHSFARQSVMGKMRQGVVS
jgi:hypothetical protein